MIFLGQSAAIGSKAKNLLGAFFALLCFASFVSPAHASDTFPGTTITGGSGSLNSSNAAATSQSGEPATYGGGSVNSMWYSWTAPSNGTLTVQTCGGTTNFDTTLQTFTGSAVGTLTNVATNDDSCGLQSLSAVTVTSGTTYRIQVDGFGNATGNFTLSWSFAATVTADLSLTQTVSSTTPQSGARVDYTLTVTNSSSSTATASGIQVTDVLNSSLIYRSQSGTGTYNSATGIWSVGSLAPGASATMIITVANNAVPGTTIGNYAQITASSVSDPDSTVNNGSTTEDDDESTNITIANFAAGGTSPTLTCPVTSAAFDWDAQAWTAGALSGSFNVTNIGPISLAMSGSTNRLIADPSTGSATPVRNTSSTGGAAGQNSLMLALDLANTSEAVTATWTFANGVAGLQFTLADIDLFYGQFEDRVTVTGSYLGVSVTPTLTNFGANSVSGNTASGTALATNTNADGNVRVTFQSPVDTVTINYGSAASAPTDPGIQAIALMDMTGCGAATDLALAKSVSASAPSTGAAISYTLTATNTTANAMNATGVAVSDALPAGFTFVSASGTGSYSNATGIWTIGALAKGGTATLTINGTVSAAAGTTVTNIAQVSTSSLPDPDSTVNNGVTTEDDYASVAFTVPSIYNCPTGSTSTGSGYATGGTGLYQNQIFWLDWTCGGTTSFPAGSTINKSWNAGDGLVITGQVTSIVGFPIESYSTGFWGGDRLDDMYPGVNPIGLGGAGGNDPSFRVSYSATLNGTPVSLRYVVADAEDTGTSGGETMSVTSTGSAWTLIEQDGGLNPVLAGANASWTGTAVSNNGSLVIETSGTNVTMDASAINQGGEFFAFGIFTPFDYSDAPLTGTSYGATNHRTISALRMGTGVTSESTAYDSPDASADVDGAVTFPSLFQSTAASISVPVSGPGYLSAWADWNDDGDFADAGEKYASDVTDGGSGDSDATVNGTIVLAVTPPATAATTATIGRLRFSSLAGAPISGLYGFGEVEDYQLTVIYPNLSVTKTSTILADGFSGTNPKAIPGATVRYCILATNTGSATATSVAASDHLPANVSYIAGSMMTGTSCVAAATPEDDNNTDADESDPFGMAFAAGGTNGTGIVTGTATTLAPGASLALVFNALVN